MAASRICLNMIVKDEAPVIVRCLTSVLPFIDRWVIVDTGSGDGTQDLVRQHLAGIPGELFERPWRNFAHNRNEALALARSGVSARGAAEYFFFIDADETLELRGAVAPSALTADAYDLTCEYGGLAYSRCALVNARLPWRWDGVVHEAIVCEPAPMRQHLNGARVIVSHDGARSREVYRRRAAMGGWEEEVWYALYQVAVITERLQADPAEVSWAYLRAWQRRPSRAEPLVHLARFHRLRGEHTLALLYARQALATSRPGDLLFVEEAAYRWQTLDELSVSAWYADARDEGARAIAKLLAMPGLPEDARQRAIDNERWYRQT